MLSLGPAGCSEPPDVRQYAASERTGQRPEAQWPNYLGDKGFSHYSSLSQVNRDNVASLQEVWRYNAGGAADDGTTQMQCSPLMVKGILYCTSPQLHLFALDAASGQELWRFDPSPDVGWIPNPNRGVVYWQAEDGKLQRDQQRILYTAGSHLYAVNARTGEPVNSFGNSGKVDLHTGLSERFSKAEVIATTPGSVYRDLLIIGSRVSEFRDAAPGHIRAFDIVTGELRWVFRTIPGPGEVGEDSWPPGSWETAGGANSWAGIAVDEQRGLAFVPTGAPTFDFYGGDRKGDNLFANSLVALDASTGKRVWHYQFVRHDLWDRDLPAPPNLITLRRDGQDIPAVAQVTKTGHVFVFHRETGEPLFPIREVPVAGEGVAGEQVAATQPLPSMPPPFAGQEFAPTTRTPAMAAAVRARVAKLDYGGPYIAPSTRGTVLYPGMDGGAEWGGAAFDERSDWLYVNSNEVPYLLQLTRVSEGSEQSPRFAYLMLCSGCHGADLRGDGVSVPGLLGLSQRLSLLETWRVVKHGRGRMPSFAQQPWYARAAVLWHVYSAGEDLQSVAQGSPVTAASADYLNAGFQRLLDPEGLPASKPPWGALTAIDLAKGEIAWRIPLGDYPEILQRGESGYGAENYGGPLLTGGGLLFIAATPDGAFRAYDKNDGKLLWHDELPAAGFATPITYAIDGRQYIVIAAGGGKLGQPSGSSYVAYALPAGLPGADH